MSIGRRTPGGRSDWMLLRRPEGDWERRGGQRTGVVHQITADRAVRGVGRRAVTLGVVLHVRAGVDHATGEQAVTDAHDCWCRELDRGQNKCRQPGEP